MAIWGVLPDHDTYRRITHFPKGNLSLFSFIHPILSITVFMLMTPRICHLGSQSLQGIIAPWLSQAFPISKPNRNLLPPLPATSAPMSPPSPLYLLYSQLWRMYHHRLVLKREAWEPWAHPSPQYYHYILHIIGTWSKCWIWIFSNQFLSNKPKGKS